jgi:hypothetical protein
MADITAVSSKTIIARTVFGNKRIVIADLHIGDGALTLAATGVPLTPEDLNLVGFDFLSIEGASLVYKYSYTTECILGYTSHATPGATVLQILATGSTPHETVRVTAIGYGGS